MKEQDYKIYVFPKEGTLFYHGHYLVEDMYLFLNEEEPPFVEIYPEYKMLTINRINAVYFDSEKLMNECLEDIKFLTEGEIDESL